NARRRNPRLRWQQAKSYGRLNGGSRLPRAVSASFGRRLCARSKAPAQGKRQSERRGAAVMAKPAKRRKPLRPVGAQAAKAAAVAYIARLSMSVKKGKANV